MKKPHELKKSEVFALGWIWGMFWVIVGLLLGEFL